MFHYDVVLRLVDVNCLYGNFTVMRASGQATRSCMMPRKAQFGKGGASWRFDS